MTLLLYTVDGQYITSLRIQPPPVLPHVVEWKGRYFVVPPADAQIEASTDPDTFDFQEAITYVVSE